MKNTEPVKTQEEFEEVEKYLVDQAMQVLEITEKAAKLRVKAIIKSGILSQFGTPLEESFQVAIDAAMRIPQMGENEEG
jgi:hypothetical protein